MSATSESNKRIAKNTVILYCRSILVLLVSLYTSRLALQILGVSDYGVYNIVGGFVAMFSILTGSMVNASQRFITYSLGEGSFDRLRQTFHTCVSLHIVLAVLVVAALEVLGIWFLNNKLNIPLERKDVAFWVMQCSIAVFAVNVISIPYNALIIAHEKMSAFAYISILEAVLKLLSVVVLVFTSFDKLLVYAVMLMVFAVVIRFVYSIYCLRHFEEAGNFKFGVNKELFGEMFAFAGWNMFGNGSAVLRNQGIDVLLNLYFGVVVNAAKGVTNQVQNAVISFITNFQTAVNPQITKSIAQGDLERNHALVFQGGRFSFYLLSVFSIPIIVTAPDLLSLWLVEVPPFTVEFVRWTLVYLQWDVLSRFLINSVLAFGKIRTYQICAGGTKLTALPIVWIILENGGSPIVGIWVNIALEIVCLGIRLYFNKLYNRLPCWSYLLRVVLPCWALFAVGVGFAYSFSRFVSECFFADAAFGVVVVVVLVWLFGINRAERELIVSKFMSKLKC